MGKEKEGLKLVLAEIIAKGAVALAKIVKSKLLPKVEEKYCKVLLAVSEKVSQKTEAKVLKITKEENVKKRVAGLYLLRLIKTTLETVVETLTKTVEFIVANVDFKEIEEPTEEAKVALAEIPGATGCNDDGCEIA